MPSLALAESLSLFSLISILSITCIFHVVHLELVLVFLNNFEKNGWSLFSLVCDPTHSNYQDTLYWFYIFYVSKVLLRISYLMDLGLCLR